MKHLEPALALLLICIAYTWLGWRIAQATITHDHQAHFVIEDGGERWECR